MADVREYRSILDGLESEWNPVLSRVAKELFCGPRRGLTRAEQRADAAANLLAATTPPAEIEVLHAEFIGALRETAAAAREVARGTGWRTGRGSLRALRQTGSLDRLAGTHRQLRTAVDRLQM